MKNAGGKIPTEETLSAIKDFHNPEKLKTHDNVGDLMEDLKSPLENEKTEIEQLKKRVDEIEKTNENSHCLIFFVFALLIVYLLFRGF